MPQRLNASTHQRNDASTRRRRKALLHQLLHASTAWTLGCRDVRMLNREDVGPPRRQGIKTLGHGGVVRLGRRN
eukprot:6202380-Lingulodinium_polyedra.AAC.1